MHSANAMTPHIQLDPQRSQWLKTSLWAALIFAAMALFLIEPAFATGTGGAAAASTRINAVVAGWQGIVTTIGVGVLVMAWMFVGYMIAFNGKTLKDMQGPLIGSTIAGLAPVLVGWMFS